MAGAVGGNDFLAIDRTLDRICMIAARIARAGAAVVVCTEVRHGQAVAGSFGLDLGDFQCDWSALLNDMPENNFKFYKRIPKNSAASHPFNALNFINWNMLRIPVRTAGTNKQALLLLFDVQMPFHRDSRSVVALNSLASLVGDIVAVHQVTVVETGSLQKRVGGFEEALASPNPMAAFLLDTLTHKRKHRNRNDFHYVTVRSWRTNVKSYQISAIKALKQDPPPEFVVAVAAEIADAAAAIYGRDTIDCIVPIPCGHSRTRRCLSVHLAENVAMIMNKDFQEAFEPRFAHGSSHPATNANLQPIKLVRPPRGKVLLVDDIATSGQHLEEAAAALRRQSGHVFAIAWLGA